MPTISVVVSGSTTLTITKEVNIVEDGWKDILDLLVAKNTPRRGDGQPPTYEQVFNSWVDSWLGQVAGEVQYKKQQDAAAAANISPISFS